MSGAAARRYTAGLYDYAKTHGVIEIVDQGLKLIAETLQAEPKFRSLLSHPLISADKKAQMLQDVFGTAVDPVVARFLNLLCSRGRADQLLSIYEAFDALAQADKGVVAVQVESAFDMNEQQVAELEQQLSAALHKQARAVVEVNKGLIAGYRVRVGNRVLDATVLGAVQQAGSKLKNPGAIKGSAV